MTAWDYFNAHPWLSALWWVVFWLNTALPAWLVIDDWHSQGVTQRRAARERAGGERLK